jgi:hypothetical protein
VANLELLRHRGDAESADGWRRVLEVTLELQGSGRSIDRRRSRRPPAVEPTCYPDDLGLQR